MFFIQFIMIVELETCNVLIADYEFYFSVLNKVLNLSRFGKKI